MWKAFDMPSKLLKKKQALGNVFITIYAAFIAIAWIGIFMLVIKILSTANFWKNFFMACYAIVIKMLYFNLIKIWIFCKYVRYMIYKRKKRKLVSTQSTTPIFSLTMSPTPTTM